LAATEDFIDQYQGKLKAKKYVRVRQTCQDTDSWKIRACSIWFSLFLTDS